MGRKVTSFRELATPSEKLRHPTAAVTAAAVDAKANTNAATASSSSPFSSSSSSFFSSSSASSFLVSSQGGW